MALNGVNARTQVEYSRILNLAWGSSTPPFQQLRPEVATWSDPRRRTLRAATGRALEVAGADEDEAWAFVRKSIIVDARRKRTKVRGPAPSEAKLILAAANGFLPAQRAMVRIMMFLGVRADELVTMSRFDVERAADGAELVFLRKGGSEKSLPADFVKPELRALLEAPAKKTGEPWERVGQILSPATRETQYHLLRRLMIKVCEKAGVRSTSPHKLRHWFATWHYDQHKDLLLTMEAMGHASITDTRRYIDVDRARLKQSMRPPDLEAPDGE